METAGRLQVLLVFFVCFCTSRTYEKLPHSLLPGRPTCKKQVIISVFNFFKGHVSSCDSCAALAVLGGSVQLGRDVFGPPKRESVVLRAPVYPRRLSTPYESPSPAEGVTAL